MQPVIMSYVWEGRTTSGFHLNLLWIGNGFLPCMDHYDKMGIKEPLIFQINVTLVCHKCGSKWMKSGELHHHNNTKQRIRKSSTLALVAYVSLYKRKQNARGTHYGHNLFKIRLKRKIAYSLVSMQHNIIFNFIWEYSTKRLCNVSYLKTENSSNFFAHNANLRQNMKKIRFQNAKTLS